MANQLHAAAQGDVKFPRQVRSRALRYVDAKYRPQNQQAADIGKNLIRSHWVQYARHEDLREWMIEELNSDDEGSVLPHVLAVKAKIDALKPEDFQADALVTYYGDEPLFGYIKNNLGEYIRIDERSEEHT